ncbi:MAG: hypothetical protein ACHQ51_08970 [Elusimicrobiota bacterium]
MRRFAVLACVVLLAAAPAVRLHLGARARKHILSEHFPGGGRTNGKSVFNGSEDLDELIKRAEGVAPKRERNGRDKRVVRAGRAVGVNDRTGKPETTYVVIAEPDGEVVTAYPGR